MIVIGLLLFVFSLIIYVLLVPIILVIDTDLNLYYIKLRGLVKASVESHREAVLRVELKIFFMNFYFYPLREIGKTKRKKLGKRNLKKHRKKISVKQVGRFIKSFKVQKFLVNIDTGNCIYNAKLFPIFYFLNSSKGKFKINFIGKNQLVIHLQNRPIHIIKSFINI